MFDDPMSMDKLARHYDLNNFIGNMTNSTYIIIDH